MRRNAARNRAERVSLFPFLAVLICTMGTLVVLLVVVMQQARVQAKTIAEGQAETLADREALRLERETHQWRADLLLESREKTAANLADHTLALSHLEDHIRRLFDRLQQLESQAVALESAGNDDSRDRDAVQAEIDRLAREIDRTTEQLDAERAEARRREKRYALIPYEGPNGTRRRPIYVECRDESVILQPEGIVLTERDFRPPIGPENALAAALRAKREYLARTGLLPPGVEPYPLLIVRPGGANGYAAAREAMAAWEHQFGYELVGADWELEFPPADPTLAESLQSTVDAARQRRHRLELAAPGRYGRADEGEYYRLSSRGGMERVGGSGDRWDRGADSIARAESARGPGDGLGGGSRDASRRAAGTGSPGTPGGDAASIGLYGGRPRGATAPGESGGTGGGLGNGTGPSGPDSTDRAEAAPTGQAQGSAGDAAGTGAPSSANRHAASDAQRGEHAVNGPAGASDGPGGTAASGGSLGAVTCRSLAETRGRNWGLKDATPQSIGITRPIRVLCTDRHCILVPERGTGDAPRVVTVGDSMRTAIDEFVSEIWKYTEGWGIAGRGMHWEPILSVEVRPGGETHFQQLQTLLHGSGIQVKQK